MVLGNAKKFILVLLLLAYPALNTAHAFSVSSDDDYFVSSTDDYDFIFAENFRPYIKALQHQNHELKQVYRQDFAWQLDEKVSLILTSQRNQIANGFATLFPTLHTVFYGGGSELIDDFATTSWSRVLLIHETAHLYQLDHKKDYSVLLHKYLGNPLPNIVPPFTYMMVPNIFLPTFILEGNAVFNEGRFGNGGRLYSGEYRALLLNLVRANKINSTRLMNDHIIWPYGQEKYLIGGYFQLYLAETYGIAKTNQFFATNASYFFLPFQLKKSFVDTFGVSYDTAISNFIERYRPLAAEMQAVPGTTKIRSITHRGLARNPSNGHVTFFTTDGKSRPLYYDVSGTAAGLKIEKKSYNIPMGEPIYLDGRLYTTSAETVHHNQIRAGLFSRGYKARQNSLDHYVYDTYKNKKVYAFVPDSFVESQIYESDSNNGGKRFVGVAHSSPLYGPNGDLYYFKQNGTERALMKNGQAVISFKGHYGKVADVLANGDVYFTAATERGTSLFRYTAGKIERMHTADTIVDAKALNEKDWIVAETTATGFEYKVVTNLQAVQQGPVYYSYFYENNKATAEANKAAVTSSVDAAAKAIEAATGAPGAVVDTTAMQTPTEEPYSSWGRIRFNGIDPMFAGLTEYGPILGVAARFSDPMQYHNVSLSYAHLTGGTSDSFFMYTNREHRLNWTFAAGLDQSAIFDIDSSDPDARVIARYETWIGAFQLSYPLFVLPQISGTLTTRYNYEYDDTDDAGVTLDREQSVLTYFDLTRTRAYTIAHSANARDQFVIAHEAIGDIPKWEGNRVKYAAVVNFTRDIIRESYLSVGYHAVKSDSPTGDIEIDEQSPDQAAMALYKPTELVRYSEDTGNEYSEAHKFSAGFKQAINWSYYFKRFPISLRRLAPFAIYQEFYTRDKNEKSMSTLFHEWAYGVEFELLLVHKFPVRISAFGVDMNKREGTALTLMTSFQNNF